jgi:pimeloyl-ACP methyl ester carboxylesterase
MNAFRERWLECTGEVRMYFRDYAGPPGAPVVLCMHGLTRNSRDFAPIAEHLAIRYRVLAPDLRGRGFSERDPNWRNYFPTVYIDDMWRLLDAEEVGRVALLGTSLGGLIAMPMAADHPERVRCMILNDVGPEVAPEGLARIVKYIGVLPPVASWEEAASQCREAYAVTLPEYGEQDWLAFARKGYRENSAGVPELDFDPAIAQALREVGGTLPDAWGILQRIRVPVLCLRGAMSDILSVEILERMKTAQPAMRVVTIPNRGHVPQLDEPESVAAIDDFLAAIDGE